MADSKIRRPKQARTGVIRCPYCVEDSSFKEMIGQGRGDWYMCAGCGHLALLTNPLFECTCSKCVGLRVS
jgi:DNA-directed RNA polymerase subunit RPC12/RpoP